MSAKTLVPAPSRVLAWRFPETIETRCQALGLPGDTLVYSLGRRWLTDGSGGFWPGGRGNKTFLRELLAAGSIRVESLPVVAAGEELATVTVHLLNAVLARRGNLTHTDCEALFPVSTAYIAARRAETVRHILTTARERQLDDWLATHLGELSTEVSEVERLFL